MFSGLVEGMASVQRVESCGPGKRFWIDLAAWAEGVTVGDSIAVSGCCLTVVRLEGTTAAFEAGTETLRRTTLGELGPGSRVNIERSLRLADRLGGHLVTGHVDTVGRVVERADEAEWSTFWFAVDPRWIRQMASKGSIAVDGVSLTLVDVLADRFSVALIPHTLSVTTLGDRKVGDRVNIETDLLAKYVEQQLAHGGPWGHAEAPGGSG